MGHQKEYFAIFAGGGVRGTAYIGALQALQTLDIKLTGYASSSVGAIIAALISVGYNHEELKDLLLNVNYQRFKDLYLPF
jgi:NTE family protein